jgi:uncharacterized protein (DUF2141 family)
MRKPNLKRFFFLALFLLAGNLFLGVYFVENSVSKTNVQYGTLHVVASKFRNKKGIAQFTLFNSKKGFPDQVGSAYRTKSIPLSADRAEAVFENIPYGSYAVGALHDENANGILDKNFIGMPKEGTGASNNAQGKMGPPSFEDAEFIVNARSVTIQINIVY